MKVTKSPATQKRVFGRTVEQGNSTIKAFLTVFAAYFSKQNKSRWKAYLWSLLMVVLMLVETSVLVQFSYAQRNFSTAMSEKDIDGFYAGIRKYLLTLGVAGPLFALSEYSQGRLALSWREWLTKHLSAKYFSNTAYYHLKQRDGQKSDGPCNTGSVDNPDQRIAQDVTTFTRTCVSVVVNFGGKIVRVITFLGILYSISPELVVFCVGYSVICTLFTSVLFAGRLTSLHLTAIRNEADFRFSLVRVREHAEEIAFYHGGLRELKTSLDLFDSLLIVKKEGLKWNGILKVFQNSFQWLTAVLPYLFVAHRYFEGEMEFGAISQTATAFHMVQGGLGFITQKLRDITTLMAESDRLNEITTALDSYQKPSVHEGLPTAKKVSPSENDEKAPRCTVQAQDGSENEAGCNLPLVGADELVTKPEEISMNVLSYIPGAPALSVSNMTLMTPDRETLICQDLSFQLNRGESLLLFARSGAGKSSLLRALAGLWRLGKGGVSRPADKNVLFLSQKPYMPLGSLKDQMLYPSHSEEAQEQNLLNLEKILNQVHLPDLSERVGGLDSIRPWGEELSLGEQQRLSFSRVLCGRPEMTFLDESTSNLDGDNESMLYSILQQRVPCYISIGHRPSLFAFHTHVLEGDGEGHWYFQKMEDFLMKNDKHA